MYTAHFGLAELPFSMTPDPRYLYMSELHQEALAHLLYGVGEGGGFVQLTGEVGTGKTTLCRALLEQLPPQVDVAFVLNPRLTDIELLAAIGDELRVPYPPGTASRKVLVDALHHHLLDAHGRGRRTVLILDEAQDLAPDVLEQIRLLTNLETATEKLLQIILIGQPELIRLLEREDLRQLAQRVTARYHLEPFSPRDTRAYILHRLAVAGRREPVFSESAIARVHQLARGVPRLINAICDRALLGAFTQDTHRVGVATVNTAAREVLGARGGAGRRRRPPWAAWAAAAAVATVAVGSMLWLARGPAAVPTAGALTARMGRPAGSDALVAAAPASPAMPTRGASPGVAEPGAAAPPREPARAESAAAGPGAPGLAALLADPGLRADKRAAFASLYARWRVDFDAAQGGPGCERGRAAGLECLYKSGTWAKLRRYDVPAIVELTTPAGDRRYGTVVALGEDTVTLELGDRRQAFPLREVDRYWDGAFMMLWKAPAVSAIPILPGSRGRDVEWLRLRVSEADGAPPGSGRQRDVFDDELRARVANFQRARALVADGIVGDETMSQLVHRDPGVPRLSRAGS